MNCESCALNLRELVRGTLDHSTATEARKHLKQCGKCRRLYEQLTEDAPLVSRPLQTASSRSIVPKPIEIEHSSKASSNAPPSYATGWPGSIAFVGRLAMGRQVAAAAVMLVVVAVGLWYVPQLRQRPEAVGSTLTHSAFLNSEPSSDRLKPAEPLDLAIDKRSGRIHPKGVEPPMVNALRRGSSTPVEKQIVSEAEKSMSADASAERSRPQTGGSVAENAEEKGLAALPTAPTQADAIAPGSSDASAQKSEEIEPASAIFERAISYFRTGNYEEAIKAFSQIADQREASNFQRKAFLYLGRSYRDSGRCELAIPSYRKLIARYPVTPEGGDAMIEAASCYRRMGEPEQANKLIERASQHRWLTPRARHELKRLGY